MFHMSVFIVIWGQLTLLQKLIFFFFGHATKPEIEAVPPALEAQSLNH